MKNRKIKNNLKKLCEKHLKKLQALSFNNVLEEIYYDLYEIPTLGDPDVIEAYNEQTNVAIEKSKSNYEFKSLMELIKNETIEDDDTILDFINELKKLFKNKEEFIIDKNLKNQIIFFEYDYEPEFSIYGYGMGDYNVLYKPTYFDFNYNDEVFYKASALNFSSISKNKTDLNKFLEELDFDAFYNTNYFETLLQFYKYKVFYLLHKSIDIIGIDLFDGINIEKPLFLYGNEKGCEPISIYVFEDKKNLKGFTKNLFKN